MNLSVFDDESFTKDDMIFWNESTDGDAAERVGWMDHLAVERTGKTKANQTLWGTKDVSWSDVA